MTTRYRVHGVSIASEIALPEPAQPADEPPDLTILRGEPLEIPLLEPNVAQLRHVQHNVLRYEGHERDGTWMLQIPRLVRFVVDGPRMTGHASHDAAPGSLELLLAGTGLSFAFTVRGDLVLHASAVTTDEGCVAFVGESGQGKTTLAALAACAGFGFFADDVLRLQLGDEVRAHRGATEARLRTSPLGLGIVDPPTTRTTIDDRFAVALERSEQTLVPLAAVVSPRLQRNTNRVAIRRLEAEEAFTLLLRATRIVGWTHATILEQQFQSIAQLVAATPVLEVEVPWGIPPPASLAREVIDGVRECAERTRVAT